MKIYIFICIPIIECDVWPVVDANWHAVSNIMVLDSMGTVLYACNLLKVVKFFFTLQLKPAQNKKYIIEWISKFGLNVTYDDRKLFLAFEKLFLFPFVFFSFQCNTVTYNLPIVLLQILLYFDFCWKNSCHALSLLWLYTLVSSFA